MANNHFDKKGKNNNSKWGIFAAICLCMVAIGAAAWFALDAADGDKNMTSSRNGTSNFTSTSSHNKIIDTVSDELGKVEDGVSSVISDITDMISSDMLPDNVTSDMTAEETVTEASFFVMPLAGEIIKDYSGEELVYSETFTDYRTHKGVDIAAPAGTAVNASGHGVVTDVFVNELLGTVVAIDHGNGTVCYYCGLNEKPLVKKGDAVQASQPIGAIGVVPGESVEAAHLHLEVKKDGEYVSPLEFLGLN